MKLLKPIPNKDGKTFRCVEINKEYCPFCHTNKIKKGKWIIHKDDCITRPTTETGGL